jgi:hypothetical protein
MTIPFVLCVLQDVEDDSGILPQHGMTGDGKSGRVLHSMNASNNLVNASHYNTNDTKNWHFVLPNVFGKKRRRSDVQSYGHSSKPWCAYKLGWQAHQALHSQDGLC